MRRKVVRAEVIAPPIASFESKGRSFYLSGGRHVERFPDDARWFDEWPIMFEGEPAGRLFRSHDYGKTDGGLPRWHASITDLRWTKGRGAPTGIGFDVAAFDTAEEALAAWGRSADQILDWSEGKPVRSMYSKSGVFQKKASES